MTYGTALFGLKDRGRLKPGETIAVIGAAGGAGLAAVEIANLMGGRVVAVASSAEKLAVARAHGAAEGIDYQTEDLKMRLKELTGGTGVDVLYDCVGGPYAESSVARHGVGGALSRGRLRRGRDTALSAQCRDAQRLLGGRRVVERLRRASSGPAPRQYGRAARVVPGWQDRATYPRRLSSGRRRATRSA